MIRRLRKKFILAALLAVFLVLLVLIGAINALNYRSLVARADSTLQILAANGGRFPEQMRGGPDEAPEGGFPPSEPFRRDRFGTERGGFGELAFQSRYFAAFYDGEGTRTRLDLDNLASLTEAEAGALADTVYASGREKGFSGIYRCCRAALDGETVLLFLNCQRDISVFRGSLLASVGISLGGLAAVLLLLLLFSGRIVRPIAESYDKQKRFITDAGHELKTPITIIRADADVLESELEQPDNEWLADIRRQTGRLAELTEELIYLSRMEENAPLQTAVFSLSALAEESARSFQSLALSQGKDFQSSVQPELRMLGDEKAVGKLLSVLLDNAMKYSPEGGWVSFSLCRAGAAARLLVKNNCAPIEKGSADRLFERFTRADPSRSSDSGGFGLGLAIAKAVTEAHGGRIRAESEDGLSLTVTAELPLV